MPLMRTLSDVTVIDLIWDGPLTLTEVARKNHDPTDYGIYQVYGTYNSGADQLLYIGGAPEKKFGVSVPSIRDWAD